MNDKTKQAIEDFVNWTPKNIDTPINYTDRKRVFAIASAAYEAQDALSDVYEELGLQIQGHKFLHANELLASAKHDIGLILEFLKYQHY